MSAFSNQPTILLLQGSFQLSEVYERLVAALETKGFPVVYPTLPSLSGHDKPDFASKSLTTDADAVQSALRSLVEDENRLVFVVMHSYGGLVGTEAIPEELSWGNRKARGLKGGVIHLFFFTAFILAEGQSVLDVQKESPHSDIRPDGRFTIKEPARRLYSDLPKEEADYWGSKVIYQAYNVQKTRLTRASYRYIPSTYVVCENDQAVPPEKQEMFGKSAGSVLLRLASGHSPMLSKTDELVSMITETAHKAVGQVN